MQPAMRPSGARTHETSREKCSGEYFEFARKVCLIAQSINKLVSILIKHDPTFRMRSTNSGTV